MGAVKTRTSLWTYLLPLVTYSLKVGCRIKSSLRRWRMREILAFDGMREPLTALLSAVLNVSTV
jgi:hypothetical protein